MADISGQERNAAAAGFADRLRQARWPLLAGTTAVLATYLLAGHSVLVVPGALLLVLTAAALPRHLAPAATENLGADAAEALLPLSAEYLAAAVSDPLIVFDRNATLVHANAAARAAFDALEPGLSLPLKFRAPEMQVLLDGIVSEQAGPASAEYAEKLPLERIYRVSAASVGHSTGLHVLVFKDQSEARRVDRMRADFIANASHEMRTPLASIAGFIETLRGPARDDAAAREQFLQIMQGQAERMSRLIDDLLSLSRLEMKPFQRPVSRVDLRAMLESVVASLAPLAANNGIAIELNLPDGPLDAPGDRDELVQVFQNLLENACKYGRSGGRVTVSARPGRDGPEPTVDVTVRDYGSGIAEEHIPRVTERFYRVETAAGRSEKGTGLGLAIVKHILTRHNARLSIWSEPGKGAAFTVHLPAK